MKKYTVTLKSPLRDFIHYLVLFLLFFSLGIILYPIIKGFAFIIGLISVTVCYFKMRKHRKAEVQFRFINEGVKIEYLKPFLFGKQKSFILYWSQIRSYSLRETRYTLYFIITMVNGKKFWWCTDGFPIRAIYNTFKKHAIKKSEASKKITIREVPHYLKSLSAKLVATIILLLLLIELTFYLLGIELPIKNTGLLIALNYACVIYVLMVIIYNFRAKRHY